MLSRKIYLLNHLRIKLGLWGLIKFLWLEYITNARLFHFFKDKRADIAKTYDYINNQSIGESVDPKYLDSTTINWIIPDFRVGSGGHINIFRLISHLEKQGYCCRIVIVGHTHFLSENDARDAIRTHFFPIEAKVSIGSASMKPAMFTIATSWQTAYTVHNFKATQYRCYFVQDYEPYFYAHGSDYYFAEATYRLGLYGITAGDWLANKLAAEFGMQTTSMGFSYDHTLYYPRTRNDLGKRRVFFYARAVTPRRGFELGILALSKVADRFPDIEFVLAGWDSSSYRIPFKHIDAGNIPVNKLPDIYSQCDLALVLSLTNLSLLPLELMACGCPVVSNKGENVEWLLNEANAAFADTTPDAISKEIIDLLSNEDRRKKLARAAADFARTTSWEAESEKVISALQKLTLPA